MDGLWTAYASALELQIAELTEAIDTFVDSWDGDPYRAIDTNGRPVLADMLSARANATAALAQLQLAIAREP